MIGKVKLGYLIRILGKVTRLGYEVWLVLGY